MKLCKNGHEYTEANTYVNPKTAKIQCRMCKLIWQRENREKITKWDGIERPRGIIRKKWN